MSDFVFGIQSRWFYWETFSPIFKPCILFFFSWSVIAFRDALLFNTCNFLLVFYDCSKFIVCISPELAFIFQPLHFPLSDIVASLTKIPCESVLDKSIAWGRFFNFDSERHLPWTLWLGVFTVFCDFPLYNNFHVIYVSSFSTAISESASSWQCEFQEGGICLFPTVPAIMLWVLQASRHFE